MSFGGGALRSIALINGAHPICASSLILSSGPTAIVDSHSSTDPFLWTVHCIRSMGMVSSLLPPQLRMVLDQRAFWSVGNGFKIGLLQF